MKKGACWSLGRELTIGNRRIADDEPAYVIAEIGSNHGGDMELCKKMIRVAGQSGCDAVKLQKRNNRTLYTKAFYDSAYTSEHAYAASYGLHREHLEFTQQQHAELKAFAESLNMTYLCTAFDEQSASELAGINIGAVKIASGDLTNWPLLQHCVNLGLPLIVSTGGHNLSDVDRTVTFLQGIGARFALLQATAAYPCPHELLNLRVIETYHQRYPDVVVGLSDHQDGISMAPVAWMLGARIFEKHFTLSRAAKGSDNAFSLEPEPMRRMVNDLRGVRSALGDGLKRKYESEGPAMQKMGKALYLARTLPAGHVLQKEDLAIKSPGGGYPPYRLDKLIGRRLAFGGKADEMLTGIMLAEEALNVAV